MNNVVYLNTKKMLKEVEELLKENEKVSPKKQKEAQERVRKENNNRVIQSYSLKKNK